MNTFRDLLTNIRAGARLALMLPVRREAFRVSLDQNVLLMAVQIIVDEGSTYAFWGPEVLFRPGYLMLVLSGILAFLFACYLTARIQAQSTFSTLVVLVLAAGPTYIVIRRSVDLLKLNEIWYVDPQYAQIFVWVCFLWYFVIVIRVLRLLYPSGILRTAVIFSVYTVCVLTPRYGLLWVSNGFAQESELLVSDDAGKSTINVEETYYRQGKLLRAATGRLKKERPGVTDLYFLGFGGDADDDVFLKEVRSVTRLFDRRFGTKGRSVMLINHEETVRTVPLANGHNLYHALQAIGRRMNKDEDVLFLFMTSHGDREHNLSVRFGRLQLNAMPASYIRRVLDKTGIKWRVIVVSACFSGGFIDHLQDEHTLIMTAARRDRSSFGCGDAFDFTYFGQAYFDEALRRTYSFTDAFDIARKSIEAREKQEDITASEPQIFIGERIKPKLEALEARFVAPRRKGPSSPLTNATAR